MKFPFKGIHLLSGVAPNYATPTIRTIRLHQFAHPTVPQDPIDSESVPITADASFPPHCPETLPILRRWRAAREVAVHFAKCVSKEDRKDMEKVLHTLGGRIVEDDTFTHFVALPPLRGKKDRGFVKSLNVLIALAAGWSFGI